MAAGVSQPLACSYRRMLPLAHMRLDGIQLSRNTRKAPQGLGIGRAVFIRIFRDFLIFRGMHIFVPFRYALCRVILAFLSTPLCHKTGG